MYGIWAFREDLPDYHVAIIETISTMQKRSITRCGISHTEGEYHYHKNMKLSEDKSKPLQVNYNQPLRKAVCGNVAQYFLETH